MKPILKKITFAWGIHLTPHPNTWAFLCPPPPPRGLLATAGVLLRSASLNAYCTVNVAPAGQGGGDCGRRDWPLEHYTKGPAQKMQKKMRKMRKNADRNPPPRAWIVVNSAQDQNGSWRSRGAGRVLLTGGGVGGPGTQKSKSMCTKNSQINNSFCKISFFPTMKPGSEGTGYYPPPPAPPPHPRRC